jgi:UDP-N-acetylglucosamine 2-epimerase (non-hydrolysing)
MRYNKTIAVVVPAYNEETSFLNIQCITFRKNTERPVTITRGTNVLVNMQEKSLEEIQTLLLNAQKQKEK